MPVKDPLPPDAGSAGPLPADDIRSLADGAPFGVFRTDTEGRCLYTNAAWQAIYGLTFDESLGDGGVVLDDEDALGSLGHGSHHLFEPITSGPMGRVVRSCRRTAVPTTGSRRCRNSSPTTA